MSDEVLRILAETEAAAVSRAPDMAPGLPGDPFDPEAFDEAAYLRLNPDVATSVVLREVASGYQHYVQYGFREGRETGQRKLTHRNRLLHAGAGMTASADAVASSGEALIASRGGGVMVVGWIDDTASPLDCIRIRGPGWQLVIDKSVIIRVRRQDVEQALGRPGLHAFGFVGFVNTSIPVVDTGASNIELWLDSGQIMRHALACRMYDDLELRNVLLAALGEASFFGNSQVERVACLDGGLAEQILAFNRLITSHVVAHPYVERFGRKDRAFRGSLVVCLYGKAEFLFIQNALYSRLPGIEDYEFIYVSNSPELGETMLREAQIASRVYGLSQTVMVLTGNAGFGAANNAAVGAARSDRILNVNPDVFPKDLAWAAKHTTLLDQAPAAQTRLFGVPLYYDDGSLMHGGMFFEMDSNISMSNGQFRRRQAVRVEHYGKGAPPETAEFLRSRPVPAVTGAFISSDRAWFEKLGGFTEDFVFGHYEDADLCLKSIQAGTPPWMHDLRMWHLEGKGSTRQLAHEGGSVVNRWLFSRQWGGLVEDQLLGPNPTHPLIMQKPVINKRAAPAKTRKAGK